MGSSPRVRGTGRARCHEGGRCGIIPARAGNRTKFDRDFLSTWDHPRACGEQCMSVSCVARSRGSSPRVRGTVCVRAY